MKERNRPIILMAVIFIGGVIHRCFLLHIAVVGNDRYKPHRRSSSSSPSLLFSSFDELCVFFIRMFMLFHLHLSSNRPSQFFTSRSMELVTTTTLMLLLLLLQLFASFLLPAPGAFLLFCSTWHLIFSTTNRKPLLAIYIFAVIINDCTFSPMCLFPSNICVWGAFFYRKTLRRYVASAGEKYSCVSVM